jgi:hypothetical protein
MATGRGQLALHRATKRVGHCATTRDKTAVTNSEARNAIR